jgi:hypothetical protein
MLADVVERVDDLLGSVLCDVHEVRERVAAAAGAGELLGDLLRYPLERVLDLSGRVLSLVDHVGEGVADVEAVELPPDLLADALELFDDLVRDAREGLDDGAGVDLGGLGDRVLDRLLDAVLQLGGSRRREDGVEDRLRQVLERVQHLRRQVADQVRASDEEVLHAHRLGLEHAQLVQRGEEPLGDSLSFFQSGLEGLQRVDCGLRVGLAELGPQVGGGVLHDLQKPVGV